MSLLDQKWFPEVEPYIKIELYGRDGANMQPPRVRIETHQMPDDLRAKVTTLIMPCVRCGVPIFCFRLRQDEADRMYRRRRRPKQTGFDFAPPEQEPAPGCAYYACTCRITTSMGCARGKEARDEYERVRKHYGY